LNVATGANILSFDADAKRAEQRGEDLVLIRRWIA
jgi:hypothetical protein